MSCDIKSNVLYMYFIQTISIRWKWSIKKKKRKSRISNIQIKYELTEFYLRFRKYRNSTMWCRLMSAHRVKPQTWRNCRFTKMFSISLHLSNLSIFASWPRFTPHLADVERCISANNLLKTSLRSNLALTTENKYLYICFNMPDLENWNPMYAIKKWMSTTRRNRTNTTETSTSKKQAYFKGVFENCDVDSDESESWIEMKFNLF